MARKQLWLQSKQRQHKYVKKQKISIFARIDHHGSYDATHISICTAGLSRVSLFLSPMAWSPPGSSVHGGSPGYNTGAGCHAFLQDMYVYTHILSPLYISLEKETATHSSHSTQYAPQTAWRATDHGGHKESDTMEHAHFIYRYASKTRDLKHKTYIIQGGKSERN